MGKSDNDGMKQFCDFYVRHAGIIGALYCVVPTLLWFLGTLVFGGFRQIYVLRMVLSLGMGGGLAAYAHRFGVSLWLAKHRSQDGPATVLDGTLIGGAVGLGALLVPPLTMLIRSTDFELTKSFIICVWLVAIAVGAIIGGALASMGRKVLESTGSIESEQTR